jgi:WD40 repeat protein
MNATKRTFLFNLLFVFILTFCVSQQETIVVIPTEAKEATRNVTSTILATGTSSPTLLPLPTVPVATLSVIATLDAVRINLINQYPELEEYGTFCQLTYCYGAESSPNGQQIIITNGNTIDLFNSKGERVGKYSFYEFYGHLIDSGDGYVSGVHWSKDGKYLYVAIYFGDGGPEPYFGYRSSLARVNLENGTWKDTGISGVISFSPNDKYIAYSPNDSEIRIRDLQSGEESTYFAADYYLYFGNFVWSPDNQKIIFTATPEQWHGDGSKFSLYMIDLESKTISNLHETSFPFYYPVSWTETNIVTLNKFEEFEEWSLDLSTNPPQITP